MKLRDEGRKFRIPHRTQRVRCTLRERHSSEAVEIGHNPTAKFSRECRFHACTQELPTRKSEHGHSIPHQAERNAEEGERTARMYMDIIGGAIRKPAIGRPIRILKRYSTKMERFNSCAHPTSRQMRPDDILRGPQRKSPVIEPQRQNDGR